MFGKRRRPPEHMSSKGALVVACGLVDKEVWENQLTSVQRQEVCRDYARFVIPMAGDPTVVAELPAPEVPQTAETVRLLGQLAEALRGGWALQSNFGGDKRFLMQFLYRTVSMLDRKRGAHGRRTGEYSELDCLGASYLCKLYAQLNLEYMRRLDRVLG